jgi:hypothetical protein
MTKLTIDHSIDCTESSLPSRELRRRWRPATTMVCLPGHDQWSCVRCGATGDHAHLHAVGIGWGRHTCEGCWQDTPETEALCRAQIAARTIESIQRRYTGKRPVSDRTPSD